MKKNLIALAVLAASGVASAQSSLTIYGIADVWFGGVKSDSIVGGLKVNGVRQTVVESGGVSASRFGFKGTEDLGSGLKANFVLEQGFNIDNGSQATAGQAFSRQSYVGFSSGFGEVRLGKTMSPFDDINPLAMATFESALAPERNVWRTLNYNTNPANTIYYATPVISGVSGAASYSLGENKTATTSAGKVGSFHVKYEGGPVYAGLAYQTEKANGAASTTKYTRLNGSYDFGVVKLLADVGRVAQDNAKATEWQIGADVPVNSALTLSGGYARSKDNAAAGNAKRSGLGFAANYSLSKRTSVYGGVHASKQEVGAVEAKTNIYAVGIRHTF